MRLIKLIVLSVGLTSLQIEDSFAFRSNLGNMITQTGCRACHPNALPVTPPSGGISVLDPETNNLVTQFVAGKDYRVRVHFSPVNTQGPFVVGYKMQIFNTRNQAAGLILDSPIGPVSTQPNDTTPDRRHIPDSNSIARVVTTAQIAQAQTVSLNWRAPTDTSAAVVFHLWRLETNASASTAGDRGTGSQAETFVLLAPSGSQPPPPPPDDGDDSETPEPATPIQGQVHQFSGDLSGGCGTIRGSSSTQPPFWILSLGIGALALLLRVRDRRVRILR